MIDARHDCEAGIARAAGAVLAAQILAKLNGLARRQQAVADIVDLQKFSGVDGPFGDAVEENLRAVLRGDDANEVGVLAAAEILDDAKFRVEALDGEILLNQMVASPDRARHIGAFRAAEDGDRQIREDMGAADVADRIRSEGDGLSGVQRDPEGRTRQNAAGQRDRRGDRHLGAVLDGGDRQLRAAGHALIAERVIFRAERFQIQQGGLVAGAALPVEREAADRLIGGHEQGFAVEGSIHRHFGDGAVDARLKDAAVVDDEVKRESVAIRDGARRSLFAEDDEAERRALDEIGMKIGVEAMGRLRGGWRSACQADGGSGDDETILVRRAQGRASRTINKMQSPPD